MPTNSPAFAAIGLSALLSTAAVAPSQTRLLRYPDIHGDRVVFTYGGDLWTADVSGGDARHGEHLLHHLLGRGADGSEVIGIVLE